MSMDVAVHGLVKRWGDTVAVNDVTFTVPPSTLTVLLGPSGCGKSTILRLIAGLETPSGGRLTIGGQDVTRVDPAKRGVSMVFQSYALFPHLSVLENIDFGLRVRRVSRTERETRCAEVARMVGLETLLDRKPAQLSGGQRQRVALARAIVSEHPVCLMDEPLSNLDAKLRATMRDEIRRLQQQLGLTMIYVTHDQTEAMSMADQIVLLRDGRIVQAGTPADLYERPATSFAAQFIGMPPMNLLPAADRPGTGAIGVRPEHLKIGTEGISARVASIDYLGADTILRLHFEGGEAMVRVPGRTDLKTGAETFFFWQSEDTHYFDDNGIRQDGP